MTTNGWIRIAVFLALILAITKPLGVFMARVFSGERTFLDPVLRPIERLLYRATGVDEEHEIRWTEYAFAMLLFSGASMLLLYLIERVQQLLPWGIRKSLPACPRCWPSTRLRRSPLTPIGRTIPARP
jgi:potassium-transporting ATPase potassium-binding subunit